MPSATRRPPAWSKWRWLSATMSTSPGRTVGLAQRGHDRVAGVTPHPRPSWRLRRSPMPVSTRTRPAGVSTSRQLSAWIRRVVGSISSVTRRSHRILGTGPNSAPASDRNQPACTRATRVPPPRSVDQSSASFIAIGRSRAGRPARRRLAAGVRSRAWNADAVGSDWPWYFEPELRRAVRPLDRRSTS